MFNKDTLKQSLLKKQSLVVLSILAAGCFGIVYASGTTITDTSITTPNLTVTGTCTGCGAGEGSFTNWNTIMYNMTTSTVNLGPYQMDNSANVQSATGIIFANGTITQNYGGSAGSSIASESMTGKYQIYDNATITSGANRLDKIFIISNGSLKNTITVKWEAFPYPDNGVICSSPGDFMISPDGHYILQYSHGITSGGSCDTTQHRYILFRGS